MPRQRSVPTDFQSRLARTIAAAGRPGRAGLNAIGPHRRGGGGQQSVLANISAVEQSPTGGGQLLVLSATGASIASGGDYVTFDAEVYRHGFDSASLADGQTVTWPTSFAGGAIQVEFEWVDGYEGGGTIEIEVNGVVPPWGLVGAGTEGVGGCKGRYVHLFAGDDVRIKVTHNSGSAQLADAWVTFACPDPAQDLVEEVVETVWLDSRGAATVTSTRTLVPGVPYTFTVEGNLDGESSSLSPSGADAVIYPSEGQGASTDGNFDADTKYAKISAADGGSVPIHSEFFTIDLGSGANHVEPVGGPFASPQDGHVYTFTVTGQGSPVTFAFEDPDASDNNGQFRIDIRQGS